MLLDETPCPFTVAEALGCLSSNDVTLGPGGDVWPTGGVVSDIGGKAFTDEYRGFCLDCTSSAELTLGNFSS